MVIWDNTDKQQQSLLGDESYPSDCRGLILATILPFAEID